MFKKENLRKNFLRVKQNIDQNLGRAEQSKVLTEDQQENEKRVEVVKHAFQNMAKKAGAMLQASGTDFDKKLKKLPESGLSHALTESAQSLGTDTLLGSVCQLCGDCQMSLAREKVQYEETVEQEFITPLQTIVDVDIPGIMKLRKALTKSTLDMDSAKSRLNQVVRQSQVPGANMTSAAAKADVLKDEYEEATLKMENIKDNLSIELCNFAARESEQSSRLLILLEAQANYHRKALEAIEECIPHLALAIKNSSAKPCYGMPLEEHLRLMCRDVALVLEACVLTLLETGMEEKGLFRIAGSAVKLKKLKACFDAHAVDMEEFSSDPHTVAGAIKLYLRELPEPLLTFELYDELLMVAMLQQDQRLQTLWTLINRLPKPNYNNLRYLVKFLAKLAEKSEINMMKPSNIAIVIGPNLMWSDKNNTQNMMTTGAVSSIIETIVTHADWFFPGELDFNVGYLSEDCPEGGQSDKPHGHTEAVHIQVAPAPQTTQNTAPPSSPGTSRSNQFSSINVPVPSDSMEHTSATLRRAGRKPAPPPPSDKPFAGNETVNTAGPIKHGHIDSGDIADSSYSSQSHTAPLATTESLMDQHNVASSLEKDKPRSPGGQSERPSVPPPLRPDQAPPERPKAPSSLNPPVAMRGHQRSASTGAIINKTSGSLDSNASSGVPNAGSLSSHSIDEGNRDDSEGGGYVSLNMAANAQNVGPSSSFHSSGHHASMRPRPTPPRILPPISGESEYTKL